ncbi:MAG: serine/threonine protein kinase, partial [Cyanobacteria bacterium P01_D01_bin.115]
WRAHGPIKPAIADIFDRMLLPSPNQRYASAQDVLVALREATSQPGAGTTPVSPPGQSTGSAAASASTALQGGTAAKSGAPVTPTPPPNPKPVKAAATPPPATQMTMASGSLLEFLGGAAFLGVEGGLLAIALLSLLGTTWLGSGAWLLLVAGLGLLQLRRVIERFDLVLIAAVTLGVVVLFPPLQTVLATTAAPRATVVVLSLMAGAAVMAAGTIFRLIYRVLSALM